MARAEDDIVLVIQLAEGISTPDKAPTLLLECRDDRGPIHCAGRASACANKIDENRPEVVGAVSLVGSEHPTQILDLGPEGWLRDKQTHVAHLQEQDDLGLLLRFGADCIGAVSVRDKNGAAQNLPPVKEATANPGRTISGVQRKLLVVEEGDHFAPAAATGPAPYIAKFNSGRLDSLVRNEALSLRWSAALLGADEVNTFTQGQVSKLNEVGLVVTRFDRTQDHQKRSRILRKYSLSREEPILAASTTPPMRRSPRLSKNIRFDRKLTFQNSSAV
ncbi:hypothetical protein ABID62_008963 [Bradyrhizobium sp. S3.9.1]